MNNTVERKVREIESGDGLQFRTLVYRPFITTLIVNTHGDILGIGTSCVQLPDKWDVEQGTKTSKVRAVKNMLGIPNPNLQNVVAHEVSRLQQTA